MICPMQCSAETIGGSLAALCGTSRFWFLPVSTHIVVRSLRMTGCMSAVFIPLLFAKKMSWMKSFRPMCSTAFWIFWWSIPPCHTAFSLRDGEVFICAWTYSRSKALTVWTLVPHWTETRLASCTTGLLQYATARYRKSPCKNYPRILKCMERPSTRPTHSATFDGLRPQM